MPFPSQPLLSLILVVATWTVAAWTTPGEQQLQTSVQMPTKQLSYASRRQRQTMAGWKAEVGHSVAGMWETDQLFHGATMIFCLSLLLSAYVLLQYALHRLEERARLVPTRSAVGRAVQEPLGSIFRPSARLSHAPDTAASAASTEESVTLAADLRKHIAKSSLFSEDLSSHQTRLRKRKPASLSNLHFAAAESSNESPFENRWSPVSPAVAIHEAQMVSPCAVVPARAHLSPRSPRFSASLARSARSPLFIAVEDGFRHLMSGGNLKSPATPKRSKTPRSPGIKVMRGDLNGIALQSPLSPKSPRKFAGFVIPNTKKGTKAVLQSPRKVKFETQSPRKMTFDDEGFTDDIRPVLE